MVYDFSPSHSFLVMLFYVRFTLKMGSYGSKTTESVHKVIAIYVLHCIKYQSVLLIEYVAQLSLPRLLCVTVSIF